MNDLRNATHFRSLSEFDLNIKFWLPGERSVEHPFSIVTDLWPDPDFQGKEKLLSLLRPYPDDDMVAIPVSTWVNNVKNQGE